MSAQNTPARPVFQPLGDDPGAAYLLWCLAKRIVVMGNGCWTWEGATNGKGYGWIESHSKRKMVHRLVYELCVGEIPETFCVLHNCPAGDNPSCCNPAHLWAGTKRDNNRDCAAKGRHSDAKIRPEQVEKIRQRLATGGRGIVKQLAEEYGVTPGAIIHIRKGRHWGHVP